MKCPFYGSRRITVVLNQSGVPINRKAVQRHMREMGIAGICPGPNLSKRNLAHRTYPYLLRGLNITHTKQVWGIRYHLYSTGTWMDVSAYLDRLVFSLCGELGAGLDVGTGFCVRSSPKSSGTPAIPILFIINLKSKFTSIYYSLNKRTL